MTTDNRSCNLRNRCPFCKKDVLSRDYGKHLIKKHEDRIFDRETSMGKTNLKNIWRDKAEKEPVPLYIGDTDCFYFCFSDNVAIKRLNIAEIHIKKNLPLHKENLLALRDKYNQSDVPQDDKALLPSVVDAIQEVVWILMKRIREEEVHHGSDPTPNLHKKLKLLQKIPFALDEKTLKEKFDPDEPEEEEEVKEEVKEEIQEEVKEIKEVKEELHPMTKNLLDMMKDKGFADEEKRNIIREQMKRFKLSHPVLEAFIQNQPEPMKQELSKDEVDEIRKLIKQKPEPIKPKPLASYSNFTTPPPQPQYPKILASTKRS